MEFDWFRIVMSGAAVALAGNRWMRGREWSEKEIQLRFAHEEQLRILREREINVRLDRLEHEVTSGFDAIAERIDHISEKQSKLGSEQQTMIGKVAAYVAQMGPLDERVRDLFQLLERRRTTRHIDHAGRRRTDQDPDPDEP